MKFLTFLSLASATLATPVAPRAASSSPSVTIQNGTVVGKSSQGIDSFLGIPFAQPPVGPLRLKPPQTINKSFGTIQTTSYATQCIQFDKKMDTSALGMLGAAVTAALANNPLFASLNNAGEDCLYLNVQRPAGTTSSSNLPVAVWIFGGGFEFGGTSTYDASRIVNRSIALGAPIVYVSMAYRVNGFGFLPGKELKQDGSTNLGLRDQRKALEWVSQNVAAFGGDPNKVTIWGESAGAISVFDQQIINGGQNTFMGKQLFRGAIMNSGSVVPARPVDSPKAQEVYDTVSKAGGCSGTADSLACLRALSTKDFTNAVSSVPGIFDYQSIDLSYVPRPDNSDAFFPISPDTASANGNAGIAAVPFIIGDQEDEGTLFALAQSNITTDAALITYINSYFPGVPRSQIQSLTSSYPDVASAGSPFGTGDFNNIYPEFKRLAAILGDITFNLVRRGYLANATATQGVPAWTYLNSYLHGTPLLGTFHAADLVVLYGGIPTTYTSPVNPIDYYISFFNYLDPNALSQANKKSSANVYWPKWTQQGREMLGFAAFNTSVIADNYREPQYQALLKQAGILQI